MDPVVSDAVAVTPSNSAANKIDFYLHRTVSYDVQLDPDARADSTRASGELRVMLDNKAKGLPQIVIGPFDPRFVAGENRSFASIYSPLRIDQAIMNGKATSVAPGRSAAAASTRSRCRR
jgi:hypothetical protein